MEESDWTNDVQICASVITGMLSCILRAQPGINRLPNEVIAVKCAQLWVISSFKMMGGFATGERKLIDYLFHFALDVYGILHVFDINLCLHHFYICSSNVWYSLQGVVFFPKSQWCLHKSTQLLSPRFRGKRN